jgi:hypothetical protein
MKRFSVLLMLVAGLVQADVYKSVNSKGEVVYSDKPTPGAERLKLPPLQTYKQLPLPQLTPTPEKPEKPAVKKLYENMAFLEPENEATVRNNQGVVTVRLALEPALKTQLGHKIQFFMDNGPHGPPVQNTTMGFSNIERGTHTLSATVIDSDEQTVMSSDTVTFHLHRESIFNPNNPKNPNRPKPTPLPVNPVRPTPTPLPGIR